MRPAKVCIGSGFGQGARDLLKQRHPWSDDTFMIVETVTWRAGEGWHPALPDPDQRSSLVLVFADAAVAEHRDRPISELAERWTGQAVIGCSTAGQVLGAELHDATLIATIVRFDSTTVRVAHVDITRMGGSRRAGRELAAQLRDDELRAILVLSDGTEVNGTALATGVADVLGDMPLFGGLAGDGERFERTWTIVDGEPTAKHVSAVGFMGDHIEFGFGSGDGWLPFGPERLVTSSFGNVLHELDDKPALALYREYLGPRAAGLPVTGMFFPLAVRDLDDRTLIRTAVHIDPGAESLTFAGDVPQGSTAQLMRASTDSLVHGAGLAAKQASLGDDQLAIAVSCVGRRFVMGERTEEELDAVLDVLGPRSTLVGFYSYGGLSPTEGTCELHNQTMTIATVRERKAT